MVLTVAFRAQTLVSPWPLLQARCSHLLVAALGVVGVVFGTTLCLAALRTLSSMDPR